MKHFFARQAECDLDEIQETIARRNSAAADRLLDEFEEVFTMLEKFPFAGTRKANLPTRLRSIPVRKYLVIYDTAVEPVTIVRILAGARELRGIFARLSEDYEDIEE